MKNIFMAFIAIALFTITLNAQWTDFRRAELVIGQPDFTTYDYHLTSTGLYGPYSVAIDFENLKLYIGDGDNHRVLRYAYPLTGNQPAAELVFGQDNFTSNPDQDFVNQWGWYPDANPHQIWYPMAIAVYKGDLWVLDSYNHRVVKFSDAYSQTTNNPDADVVIGQAGFTTRDYSCTINTLRFPQGMTIDSIGNLWVVDTGNGRVLRFSDASSLTNGEGANAVLGQSDFETNTVSPSPVQNQFGLSTSIYVKGTTAWICDRDFNRVLRFDSVYSKPDGANADAVLGQDDFTSNAPGTTQNTFNHPFGVFVDGKGTLYVSDQLNSRVLIFDDAATKSNGANADHLLGQKGFINSNALWDTSGFAPNSVTNFAMDDTLGKLFVVDRVAMRVLQFAYSNPSTGIDQEESSIINNLLNLSVYPNPAYRNTSIVYSVPSKAKVSLILFDSWGREIETLVDEVQIAGSHEVKYDGSKLPSGIYHFRLQSGDHMETARMVLIK
jgi:hypothetical protein